jgi:hypothetical protein
MLKQIFIQDNLFRQNNFSLKQNPFKIDLDSQTLTYTLNYDYEGQLELKIKLPSGLKEGKKYTLKFEGLNPIADKKEGNIT